MRDRLIELILNADTEDSYACKLCVDDDASCWLCYAKKLADHLLANGVIVPPCKVGQKTFLLLEKVTGGADIVESYCCKVVEKGFVKLYSMYIDCADIYNTLECVLDDFGQWVFLTKEEAERALKEREQSDR